MNNIELINEDERNKVELSKEEEKIQAKRNIFELYKVTYSKFNSYDPLVNDKLISLVEERILDDKLSIIYFADWLIQNQIGLLSEDDMVNRSSKKQYVRKYKRFIGYFVKKINNMSKLLLNEHLQKN